MNNPDFSFADISKEESIMDFFSFLKPGINAVVSSSYNDKSVKKTLESRPDIIYYNDFISIGKGQSTVEAMVLRLAHKRETKVIESLRWRFFNSKASLRRDLLDELIYKIFWELTKTNLSLVIHLENTKSLTIFDSDDIEWLYSKVREFFERIYMAFVVNNNESIEYLNPYILKEGIHVVDVDREINNLQYYNMNKLNRVHISYKHEEAYEDKIKKIENGLKKSDIAYSIDKKDIKYLNDIKEYEKEIGKSSKVIVFVTPAYFFSIQCMYEMGNIFKLGNVRNRVYPVVDMGNYERNGDGLNKIKDFWNNEYERKLQQITGKAGNSEYLLDEIREISMFIHEIDDIWKYLTNVNSASVKELTDNDACLLIESLKKSMLMSETVVRKKSIKPSLSSVNIKQKGTKNLFIKNNNGTINL